MNASVDDPLQPVLPPALILASGSPYRRELLQRLRLPFSCVSPDIDESPRSGEPPRALSERLAQEKARAVAAAHPRAWVIGSDQVAMLDGRAVGKPGDHERAVAQLEAASGREMSFFTALCLEDAAGARSETVVVPTRVRFRRLTRAEIEVYLRLERPYDCAGSAKAEGLGIALLESIHGDDPTALIGLPLMALSAMLRRWGYPLLEASHAAAAPTPAPAPAAHAGTRR